MATVATLTFIFPWIKEYSSIIRTHISPLYQWFKTRAKKSWLYIRRISILCCEQLFRFQRLDSSSDRSQLIGPNEDQQQGFVDDAL